MQLNRKGRKFKEKRRKVLAKRGKMDRELKEKMRRHQESFFLSFFFLF